VGDFRETGLSPVKRRGVPGQRGKKRTEDCYYEIQNGNCVLGLTARAADLFITRSQKRKTVDKRGERREKNRKEARNPSKAGPPRLAHGELGELWGRQCRKQKRKRKFPETVGGVLLGFRNAGIWKQKRETRKRWKDEG